MVYSTGENPQSEAGSSVAKLEGFIFQDMSVSQCRNIQVDLEPDLKKYHVDPQAGSVQEDEV